MKTFLKNALYSITIVALPFIASAQGTGTGGGSTGGGLQNPIAYNSFSAFIAAILNIVIAIGIPIAAVFIIYAGFLFVTARGNEAQLAKAKTALVWAIVGTAILLGANVLANGINATIQSIQP